MLGPSLGLESPQEPSPDQAVTKTGSARPSSCEKKDEGAEAKRKREQELAELLPDLSDPNVVISMFKLKEKYTMSLSASERQTRADIHASRAVYQVDQYVKLSEVRAIVAEGLEAIHSRMVRTDELSKRTNAEMGNLQSRMRTCVQQVNSVSKLKKQFDALFHELREHELKIADLGGREADDVARIDAQLTAQTETFAEIAKQVTRLEAISEVLEG